MLVPAHTCADASARPVPTHTHTYAYAPSAHTHANAHSVYGVKGAPPVSCSCHHPPWPFTNLHPVQILTRTKASKNLITFLSLHLLPLPSSDPKTSSLSNTLLLTPPTLLFFTLLPAHVQLSSTRSRLFSPPSLVRIRLLRAPQFPLPTTHTDHLCLQPNLGPTATGLTHSSPGPLHHPPKTSPSSRQQWPPQDLPSMPTTLTTPL